MSSDGHLTAPGASLWDALGEHKRMLLCDRYGLDEGQLRHRLQFADDVQKMILDTVVLEGRPPHEWRQTQSGYTICGRCGTYRDFGGEKVRCNPVSGHAPSAKCPHG